MVRLPRTARDVFGWVSWPRQIVRRGAHLVTIAPALTIAERQHIERVLGAGRLALSAAAILAVAFDPAWNGLHAQLAVALLGGYALFGSLELVTAWRRRGWVAPSGLAHGVDVAAAAALTMLTANLPSNWFFLFFLFPLLGASYRWGLRASLVTVTVAALALCAQFAFGDVALEDLLARTTYLVIAAFVVGGLGELELRRRAKASAVSGLLARLHSGTSVHSAMRDTGRAVLSMFGAERLVVAVHDPGSGASYAWTVKTIGSRARVSVREIGVEERRDYFFSAPGAAWYAPRRASGEEQDVRALGEQGQSLGGRRARIPPAIWQNSPARALAGVDVSFAGQSAGRVFLLRSRPLGASELAFFRELICHVAPAIFSLYLLRRVRARVTAAERSRVARELHDGVIQALAGLRFDVAALRRHADRGMPIEAELARLEHALAEQMIAARELMHRVRPLEVTPRQLPGYLGGIVERFTRETGIRAHYHTDVEDTDLAPRTCRELARTLQEALVNVRKHSAARHVVVRFSADPIHYRLTIDNDGRPFEFAGRLTLAELEARRRGPVVIKERVREMGGELVIESSADRGVRLDILLRRRLRAGSSKTA